MFKYRKNPKNTLSCNELIIKGMFKRRRLATAAIAQVCDRKHFISVVK